jgi:hypothetical protein
MRYVLHKSERWPNQIISVEHVVKITLHFLHFRIFGSIRKWDLLICSALSWQFMDSWATFKKSRFRIRLIHEFLLFAGGVQVQVLMRFIFLMELLFISTRPTISARANVATVESALIARTVKNGMELFRFLHVQVCGLSAHVVQKKHLCRWMYIPSVQLDKKQFISSSDFCSFIMAELILKNKIRYQDARSAPSPCASST